MKKIVFISAVIIFSAFAKQESKDVILWDENRLLTWDDFKGKPERRFAAASTAYDILKSVIKKDEAAAQITIKAVFFCKTSWKNSYWAESTILAHEQRHFDIVELFSRKLRKLLQETKYKSHADVETKADSLYAIIDKEMDAYQDVYDEESDGSMDGDKQRVWNKKVAAELKALEQYNNIQFVVAINK